MLAGLWVVLSVVDCVTDEFIQAEDGEQLDPSLLDQVTQLSGQHGLLVVLSITDDQPKRGLKLRKIYKEKIEKKKKKENLGSLSGS